MVCTQLHSHTVLHTRSHKVMMLQLRICNIYCKYVHIWDGDCTTIGMLSITHKSQKMGWTWSKNNHQVWKLSAIACKKVCLYSPTTLHITYTACMYVVWKGGP